MKRTLLILASVCLGGCALQAPVTIDRDGLARFEPPPGKVLIFVGQDNQSVGGNASYRDGYIEHVGVPAGITHYVGMGADHGNRFKAVFDDTRVDGLNSESYWGAGPMCMKYYVDSPILSNCVMHLSIAMTGNNEDKVADGTHDRLIDELIAFLREYDHLPFLIRIGYEFEGEWNGYDPENYKAAFRRIVDRLRKAKVKNFASVMASVSFATPYATWEAYYPGDEYVDWLGYSYWEGGPADGDSLQFARNKGKPVFIAESAPRGYFLTHDEGSQVWKDWYEPYFAHIEKHLDVIRAVSYINCNWDVQPMWKGQNWGDTRLQGSGYLREKWLEKLAEPAYLSVEDQPFRWIGFE